MDPRLAICTDVAAACQAAVDVLTAADRGLLPSAYVARGPRLRCLAAHGYWQVRDGIPAGNGILGRTFERGTEHVLRDVRHCADYIAAGDGVVAEVCIPLRHQGRVVGVLNVEARRPLDPDDVELVRGVAVALERRITQLGGPPAESLAQRLARHTVRLAAVEGERKLRGAVLDAAHDLLPADSAALVLRSATGHLGVVAAHGPLSDVLRTAGQEALRGIAAWTATGASCYTVAEPGEELGAGMGVLRSRGVGSLAAFAAHAGAIDAILLVADRGHVTPSPEEVEVLELLAVHAASCLRSARATRDLQRAASTDALTGLGHHAAFQDALAAAQARGDVAVLAIDVDGFKGYNDAHGHPAGDALLVELATILRAVLRTGDAVFRVGGDEFAALLRTDGASGAALLAAQRLHEAVAAAGLPVTLSVGVAEPRPGETAADAIARADAALYRVKRAGRDGVGGDLALAAR
ncbi:diguanylate cyclase [Conexibacter sp. SYSU D00693]|uniref:GGDEF domain-containing protein n=1 Tax=Conexibacter sp. SYSU D00693 TaxID=2812560 RepID=UPI00196A6BAA|nr:sensor domain-containing diguanylate cyclase [Conexibacter sp. SYSU D00693]